MQYARGIIQMIFEKSSNLLDLITAAPRKTTIRMKKFAALHAFVTYTGSFSLFITNPRSAEDKSDARNNEAILADGKPMKLSQKFSKVFANGRLTRSSKIQIMTVFICSFFEMSLTLTAALSILH
jgi:hypothetical protein